MLKLMIAIVVVVAVAPAVSMMHTAHTIDVALKESKQAIQDAELNAHSLPLIGTVEDTQYLLGNSSGLFSPRKVSVRGTLLTLQDNQLVGISVPFEHVKKGTEVRRRESLHSQDIICLVSPVSTSCSYELPVNTFR
ncbi:hypothetical protein J4N45_10205 [Vibrio sp. SCSIO 43140]|uniref:hypothetical protein n=1 Tax=Vibrio sp. SCSIO 43140 TaxID=2819100 RepID=UPI0020764CE9|nr:hypothetical protein [Vibrio sp. SCSIO 43140]USD58901.1 hypothetical protein J4N45_10205 [Vibrio sp. SCSIO 43140]